MHRLYILCVLALMAAGCSETSRPISREASQEPAITLVNTGAVDEPLLDRIRDFAEQQLKVRIRILENQKLADAKDFQTLENAAVKAKTDADVAYIVIGSIAGDDRHLVTSPKRGVGLINVMPLQINDPEKYYRRIERQVMRAAAFVFGLPPTPDPFCVTRDYRSLEDLDRMGRNYSPPWQGRFTDEAAKRGLEPLDEAGIEKMPKP